MKAAAVDPAKVQSLREQLAAAHAAAAEVPKLKESLKGSISMAELATKLYERNAEHDQATKDLRAQARQAEKEVIRLKGKEQELMKTLRNKTEWLETKHQEYLEKLQESHRTEKDAFLQRISELVEQEQKHTEEFHRQRSGWAEKEKQIADEVRRLDCVIARIFPESEKAAEAAVRKRQEAHAADGVHLVDLAEWDLEDHVAAIEARLLPVGELVLRFQRTTDQLVFEVLWPCHTVPTTPSRLAKWLVVAPGRIDEWCASATRAGAEMALSFVLPWYPRLAWTG